MQANRVDRERAFHNELYQAGHPRAACDRFYSVAQRSNRFYTETIKSLAQNGTVLEYGCGVYSTAYELAQGGARVFSIDISDVAVELARNRAAALGLQDRVTFDQMNGEALTYPDDTFDLIHGAGILHHMDLEKAFREICRTLKPTGTAVFIEPMGHNWFINLYRRLTPKLRTPDEHALTMTVLHDVNRYFDRVDLSFFHLASLLSIPFSNQRLFGPLLKTLDGFDEVLFRRFPTTRRLAWQVVLQLSRPRKAVETSAQTSSSALGPPLDLGAGAVLGSQL